MKAFVHRLRVRFNECDAQGIVFNPTYLVYVDVAMTELWRELAGSYQQMIDAGADVVVVESRVVYLRSGRADDELAVELSVGAVGTTSMAIDVRIAREDETLVEATVSYVFVDPRTHRKRPVPDELRPRLELLAPSSA